MKSSYGVSECCCIRGSIVCRTLFILLEGGANPDAGDIFALSHFQSRRQCGVYILRFGLRTLRCSNWNAWLYVLLARQTFIQATKPVR
jgi:hypothetical protein